MPWWAWILVVVVGIPNAIVFMVLLFYAAIILAITSPRERDGRNE